MDPQADRENSGAHWKLRSLSHSPSLSLSVSLTLSLLFMLGFHLPVMVITQTLAQNSLNFSVAPIDSEFFMGVYVRAAISTAAAAPTAGEG